MFYDNFFPVQVDAFLSTEAGDDTSNPCPPIGFVRKK